MKLAGASAANNWASAFFRKNSEIRGGTWRHFAFAIKICGITSVEDAELAVQAGVDAVGLNLIPGTPRFVELELGRRIADGVRGRVELVGVIADLPTEEARELRAELGLGALQLHGHEKPADLVALLPGAFKAVRIGDASDVEHALGFGGERLLVDAKVTGRLGGTGVRADAALSRQLAERRRVILAGGLGPDNVQAAILDVRPWGVDVASGVEVSGNPRRKDPDALRELVLRARSARA